MPLNPDATGYELIGEYHTDVNTLLNAISELKVEMARNVKVLESLKGMGAVHPESIIRLYDELGCPNG